MAPSSSGLVFSPAQLALIGNPGSQVVRACPGAGKTQSIVERFIRRPGLDGDRSGVALLSFTNAAIDAAQERCRDHPELLKAPNFVGTIDSFINRYIVGPIHAVALGQPPSFRDTWDNVPGTIFKPKLNPRLQMHLSWFSFGPDGTATLVPRRIPGDRPWIKNAAESIRAAVESEARFVRKQRTLAGFVDCEYARHLMTSYFADQALADCLRRRFAHRFGEVIIDEFQDSNEGDVALIRFLASAGINVVMVGDVDQAIFGFRQATPVDLDALAAVVEPGKDLDGNYRSTPAICTLVESLRHGDSRDVACGPYKDEPRPVLVLRTNGPAGVAAEIAALAAREGFTPDQLVVLAHKNSDARQYAGAGKPPNSAFKRIDRLARATATIRDGQAKPRDRAQALATFESIMREVAGDLTDLSDGDFFEACRVTERQFRAGCLRLAWRISPYEASPREFQKAIRSGIAALGWAEWFPSLGTKLKVTDEKWDQKQTPTADRPSALSWSTAHGYKGLQSPAVAVVIPKPRGGGVQEGVTYWDTREAHETRRVLYVAASRAEQLLILVVDNSQHAAVLEILKRDTVAYEEVQTTAGARPAAATQKAPRRPMTIAPAAART